MTLEVVAPGSGTLSAIAGTGCVSETDRSPETLVLPADRDSDSDRTLRISRSVSEGDHGNGSASSATCSIVSPGSGTGSASGPGLVKSSGGPPELPRIVGYTLLRLLGRGGMGKVFEARHHDLDRPVAVKMLNRAEFADATRLERFRTEAIYAAKVVHPNIVEIFDIGLTEANHPYVTMELMTGGSLRARIEGAPQPVRDSARLVVTLARAVHAAHRMRIVHRDLKPDNVLLTADGIPKIADFGLAVRLEDLAHRRPGRVAGSPSYMAPEQARGDTHEIGVQSDIYALGAILYELLTGRPPFKGGSVDETVLMLQVQEPVLPSLLVPKVPRDLETITLTCLAKEPSRRYADAEALAEDLENFLAHRPIRSRRTPAWERAWLWSQRSPAIVALILLAALLGVGAIGVGLRTVIAHYDGLRVEAERRATAEAELGDARERIAQDTRAGWRAAVEALTAFQVRYDEWPDLITRAEALQDQAVAKIERREETERRRAVVAQDRQIYQGRFLPRRDRVYARFTSLLLTAPRTTRAAGLFGDPFDESLDAGLPIAGPEGSGPELDAWSADLPDRLIADCTEALDLFQASDADGPIWTCRDLAHLGDEPELAARIRSDCVELLSIRAEAWGRSGADRLAERALADLDAAEGLLGRPTRSVLEQRIAILRQLGRNEAQARAERALADLDDSSTPSDRFNEGLLAYRAGEIARARTLFESARQAESDRADSVWSSILLGLCLLRQETPNPEAALLCFDAYPDPETPPWLALIRGHAHAIRGRESDMTQALRLYDRALASPALSDRERSAALVSRGLVHLRCAKFDPALADQEAALDLDPKSGPAHRARIAVLEAADRRVEALDAYDTALTAQPDDPTLHLGRARIRLDLGRTSEEVRTDLEAAAQRIASDRPEDAPELRLRIASIHRALARRAPNDPEVVSDLRAAEALCQQALAVRSEALAPRLALLSVGIARLGHEPSLELLMRSRDLCDDLLSRFVGLDDWESLGLSPDDSSRIRAWLHATRGRIGVIQIEWDPEGASDSSGDLHELSRLLVEAIAHYRQAIQIVEMAGVDPKPDWIREQAWAHLFLAEDALATAQASRSRVTDPPTGSSRAALDAAHVAFDRLLEGDPDDLDARVGRGFVRARMGQDAGALDDHGVVEAALRERRELTRPTRSGLSLLRLAHWNTRIWMILGRRDLEKYRRRLVDEARAGRETRNGLAELERRERRLARLGRDRLIATLQACPSQDVVRVAERLLSDPLLEPIRIDLHRWLRSEHPSLFASR